MKKGLNLETNRAHPNGSKPKQRQCNTFRQVKSWHRYRFIVYILFFKDIFNIISHIRLLIVPELVTPFEHM